MAGRRGAVEARDQPQEEGKRHGAYHGPQQGSQRPGRILQGRLDRVLLGPDEKVFRQEMIGSR